MKYEPADIDNIYLYANGPFKSKYQLLMNVREKIRFKTLKNPTASIDCWQTFDDAYENLENDNAKRKRRVLTVFDDMIADMGTNGKLSLIVTELFLRGKKSNISLEFLSKSYFKVRKTVRLNGTHFLSWKLRTK